MPLTNKDLEKADNNHWFHNQDDNDLDLNYEYTQDDFDKELDVLVALGFIDVEIDEKTGKETFGITPAGIKYLYDNDRGN
jgi:hypothetical protein